MEKLYATAGKWDDATREEVWNQWLWESDCNAPPLEQCCDMNQMHALGLLCCIDALGNPALRIDKDLLPHVPVVHLHPATPVLQLTLRQLLDQIECLQLNWGPVLSCAPEMIQTLIIMIQTLMARLGQLASHAYPPDTVLDDPQHCTPLQQLLIVSRKSLRQAICTLFSMMRVQQILLRSEPVPEPSNAEIEAVVGSMRQHHVEAAGDLFSEMQQMVHLAPGMRLVYRTNFAGMYNHVSQVVYFHYPRFSRKPHHDLRDIPDAPLHMLPLITQLIPDVPIAYDDDSHIPGMMLEESEGDKPWVWLVCCGAFFLIDVRARRLFSSPLLAPLVAHFLRSTERSLSAAETEQGASHGKGEASAPHAHVVLR